MRQRQVLFIALVITISTYLFAEIFQSGYIYVAYFEENFIRKKFVRFECTKHYTWCFIP